MAAGRTSRRHLPQRGRQHSEAPTTSRTERRGFTVSLLPGVAAPVAAVVHRPALPDRQRSLGAWHLTSSIAGLGDDAIDYLAAWDLQREVHARVVDGAQPDTVLLLEHPPVFTAGKRTDPHERPADPGGAPVIDVDRGGKITFHGPGQLVGYPIVRAARPRQGRRLRAPRRGVADRGLRRASA